MCDSGTAVNGGDEGARALRDFAALLVTDATADWTLTAPDAAGLSTLTVGTTAITAPVWALLCEVR